MAIVAQAFSMTPAADGVKRSIDPAGQFGNGVVKVATSAPTVSLTSAVDQQIAAGAQYIALFTSDFAGSWEIKAGFDGFTKSVSSDGLTCTVIWNTPGAMPGESFHVTAKCKNFGGESLAFDRVHVGINSILRVGSGETYADLVAAYAAMVPGDTVIIKDGTYTGENFRMRRDSYTAVQPYQPKTGNFTTNNGGANPVYTITQFSTVMSETPFGVILDGQGTWANGVELWGNTDLEVDQQNQGWSNGGSIIEKTGTDRRGIKIAGIVAKNTTGANFWTYHCDHIKHQYCIGMDANTPAQLPEGNATNFRYQNSTDCLCEYSFALGGGRYKFSTQRSLRVIYRRCIGRTDQRLGDDPIGFVSYYAPREQKAQNILHIDSDTSEFWAALGGVQGSYGVPSTGDNAYPQDVTFERCGTLHSDQSFMTNDGYDQPDNLTSMKWIDCWSRDVRLEEGDLFRDGPAMIDRHTHIDIDGIVDPGVSQSNFFHNGRSRETITKSILINPGWDRPTQLQADQGPVFYTGESITFDDGYIYGWTAAGTIEAANRPGPVTLTNTDQVTDPYTIGLKYLGRVEPGSQLESEAAGCNNFYFAKGELGAFYGDANDELETSIEWIPQTCYELAAPFFKAHSYTGQTRTQGIQLLDGDRGFCATGEDLREYVLADLGNTPIPLIDVQKQGGGLRVLFKPFADNHKTNITGFEVYLDNELAQTCAANSHEVLFSSLVSGHSYSAHVVAVDSVKGDSGPSFSGAVVI